MSDYDQGEANIGIGGILEWSDNGTTGWNKIGGTVEFQFPEVELGAAEDTNDDTEDFHKSYIPGLYEPGTVPFTYRFGQTIFAEVEEIFMLATVAATRATATKFWRETLPDGSTMKFKGFITKNGLPKDIEGVLTCEGEMQVVGKRTFTPAA